MIKRFIAFIIIAAAAMNLCGCGEAPPAMTEEMIAESLGKAEKAENDFAECFTIYEYENGDSLISTGTDIYLVTSEPPAGLDKSITVIPRNAGKIYMAASAVMCFYDALNKLTDIRFSALEEEGWYIENAAEAMRRGDIIYAGKYRDPDYELLLSEGCDLSLQSTMSDHTPKVREKLTDLGIPVFVDRSSYETHPLGRCEWIKVYAHLAGCPELGDALFNEQKAHFDKLANVQPNGKTAVFFYITASGKIVTRKSGDYISKLIELAGGRNVFDFVGDENALSSTTLEPEQFCLHARDADIIIYNSNIAGEVRSIDELTAKNDLLKDFRAVKNGNVWCTGRSVYQDIMKTGEILTDFHTVIFGTGGGTEYLYKLK